jgi:hypothetical protein
MRNLVFAFVSVIVGQYALAMPCDTGWACKSASGKYAIEVNRCRYTNSVGGLTSLKIDDKEISKAVLTASYDSQSIGGDILALEVSIPDSENDGHYISFEMIGDKGTVTDRVQPYNPGEQKVISTEAISCEETE